MFTVQIRAPGTAQLDSVHVNAQDAKHAARENTRCCWLRGARAVIYSLPSDPLLSTFSRDEYRAACAAIRAAMHAYGTSELHFTGCQPFYTRAAWIERGEEHGLDALLIICHDGGDFAPVCYAGHECMYGMHRFYARMAASGYRIEPCTCWYSAVYADNRSPNAT